MVQYSSVSRLVGAQRLRPCPAVQCRRCLTEPYWNMVDVNHLRKDYLSNYTYKRLASSKKYDQGDLVILKIDETKLDAPLIWENPNIKGETFPHVYGIPANTVRLTILQIYT